MAASKSTYLPYAKQHIDKSDIKAVTEALKSDFITRGPKVEEFEKTLAEYTGAQYAVAFNSASTALGATYHVIDANRTDRIFTTPNTYIATISGGLQQGATPVFLDIDLETGNLDLNLLEFNINKPSTRGRDIIVPVHFSGIAIDMRRLERMIKKTDTIVIEDAAHAIGSSYPTGEKVGCCNWSDMTVFSFHPAKNFTTGEGGLVTTNDEKLYRRLLRYRNNGIERDPKYLKGEVKPWYYEVQELSSNFNFTELQAALGLSQFEKLEKFRKKRNQLMSLYRKKLEEITHLKLLTDRHDSQALCHICVTLIDFEALGLKREELMQQLSEKGIGTQVHYIPLYRHPFFTDANPDVSQYFPNMEVYYSQALTLPLYYDMTTKDLEKVVKAVKEILQKE